MYNFLLKNLKIHFFKKVLFKLYISLPIYRFISRQNKRKNFFCFLFSAIDYNKGYNANQFS